MINQFASFIEIKTKANDKWKPKRVKNRWFINLPAFKRKIKAKHFSVIHFGAKIDF